MTNKVWGLIAVALLAGLLIGLYAGYNVGFAVRDYQAAKETIAQDEVMQDTNAELQELRLKLAVINAGLEGMISGTKKQLGIGAGPMPRPSEGD